MTFEKGSLIRVEYTARFKDDDKIVATTDLDVARDNSIYDPDAVYGPHLVSIGMANYTVPTGFNKGLAEMSVGEKNTIVVEPNEGWGERDKKKIRMYPLRKLGKDAEQYSIGDTVTINEDSGIIRYIGSGRVQVDFNSEFAGKTLTYESTVTEHLTIPLDIIRAILKFRLGTNEPKFELEGTESLSVSITDEMTQLSSFSQQKKNVIRDVFAFVPDLDFVQFVEKHVNRDKERRSQEAQTATDADPSAGYDADKGSETESAGMDGYSSMSSPHGD